MTENLLLRKKKEELISLSAGLSKQVGALNSTPANFFMQNTTEALAYWNLILTHLNSISLNDYFIRSLKKIDEIILLVLNIRKVILSGTAFDLQHVRTELEKVILLLNEVLSE